MYHQPPIPTTHEVQRAVLAGLLAVALVSNVACGSHQPKAAPVAPLSTGEVRVGDRIYMYVEGERTLSDTFTVRPGTLLELPNVGTLSLAGVPRSSVEPRIAEHIAKYVKRPVVRARALVRVGVLGEVTHPGFYSVPPDAAVSDALASAGGPTQGARMDGIRVARDGQTVADGETVRRALTVGTTLDQMGIASGDQFVVPPRKDSERILRVIGVLATIPAAILTITLLKR